MKRQSLLLVVGCGLLMSAFSVRTHAADKRPDTPSSKAQRPEVAEPVDFNRDILPILADTCYTCHGPDAATREGELRFDVRENVFADRDGHHILVPGKPEESELFRRIASVDEDEQMPPPDAKRHLSPPQIELLRRWIEQGAEWDRHWAFVPPERPQSPPVMNKKWGHNSLDVFVLARLEQEGLSPAAEADRATLIRRVSLDLTGLPPTPAEVNAFLADDSPDAYGRLVDRLLASPRFGEHMAVAWLDAARYADTDGYQNDRARYMSVWRDWVILALNKNQPFDEFVIDQLAGDMLPNATLYQQIATGFGRNHRINSEGGSIPEEWHVEYVVDRVDTLGTMFLGLTVGCARCHDHKYDPIAQKEYYQLFAYFNNVPEWGLGPNTGNSPPFIKVPKSWPNVSEAENRLIVPAKLTFQKNKKPGGGTVRPSSGKADTVMVMQEMEKPRPTYLLRRGLYNQPDQSEVLAPGLPESLAPNVAEMPKDRLELARWLVNPANPLMPRVTVNRYWQQFFGVGIVKTSENFGLQGEPPSHPKLLDYLATEYVRLKWDTKALLKLIVTSATYRQASGMTAEQIERDPENRLLARGPRLRLSAHALRDQALLASGLLVEKLGGPSVRPYMPPKIWKSMSNNEYVQDHGEKLYRRSLYTYWRRTIPPPTMMNFNASDRELCSVRKDRTNTPLHALTMMNNITFVEASRFLAERMMKEGGDRWDERIRFGFRFVTSRPPVSAETKLLGVAYQGFLRRYESDGKAAQALLGVGEKRYDKNLDAAELAAMTMVASTILNLDETLTKE